MESAECELPSIFYNGDVVGINAGFLAQGNEEFYDLMISNYLELIQYILSTTSYNIALIPHVNWNYKYSDYKTLELLKNNFRENERIVVLPERSAPQQKYVMAKCRYMIALRTHVSIPSLESLVPTIVTGYKIKSTGIVRDIFPEEFKLLTHIKSLETSVDLINSFVWMEKNENQIREYMKKAIPDYKKKVDIIKEEIDKLL